MLHFCSVFVLYLFLFIFKRDINMTSFGFVKDFAALSLLFFSGYVLALVA